MCQGRRNGKIDVMEDEQSKKKNFKLQKTESQVWVFRNIHSVIITDLSQYLEEVPLPQSRCSINIC